LAAELKEKFPNATVQLVESSGGVFEVRLDNRLIFSKKALGRHAQPGEVAGLIHAAASGH